MTLRDIDRALFSWFLDLMLLELSLVVASWLRSVLPFGPNFIAAAIVPGYVYPLVGLIWSVGFGLSQIYKPTFQSSPWRASRIIGAHVGALLILGAMLFLLWRDFSRYLFIYFALLSPVAFLGWRWFDWKLRSRLLKPTTTRAVILGVGAEAIDFYQRAVSQSQPPVHIVGFIAETQDAKPPNLPAGARLLGTGAELRQIISRERVDEVVLALPHVDTREMSQLVSELRGLAVRAYLYLDLGRITLVSGRTLRAPGQLITLSPPLIKTHEWIVKRALDWIVTVPLFILTLPVFILIAVTIKLTSPGPIIFRQERAGEFGYPFVLYKFRTMVQKAEMVEAGGAADMPEPTYLDKHPDDPRVTPVGRFLRRWSLDELPQFWNILHGDMSLVGPRPELIPLMEHYQPNDYRRLLMPPGLTGWWQINGRSNRPLYLNVQDDLTYIENYSIWLDLWILFRTPFAVLSGRGAF